jgi:prolyl oligopeptidase
VRTQTTVSSVRRAGGRFFFLRTKPGSNVAALTVRDANATERVLLDPLASSGPKGSHASIDSFEASPDGRFVAVNLGEGGGEVTRIQLIETATGVRRPDAVERVFGIFPVSWLPDASGFFYTQMADPATARQGSDPLLGMRVRFHRLGTSVTADPVVLGPGVSERIPIKPRETPVMRIPAGSQWAVALVEMTRPEIRLCVARVSDLAGTGTPWRCVADYDDQVEDFAIHEDDLYLLSSRNAPNRRILRVPLERPRVADANVLVPESAEQPLTGIATARDALYLTSIDRGRDRLARVSYGDTSARPLALPNASGALTLVASPANAGAIVSAEDLTHPGVWYEFEPHSERFHDVNLRGTTALDLSHLITESVDVPSFDGSLVPLRIARLDTLHNDSSHVALLVGYAAYGTLSRLPFAPPLITILRGGAIVANCGARGGGEKGNGWYLAGKGPNKRNGVRDFIACGEYLIAHGYTSRSRLVAQSGSMGGILLGGAITERPDLFAAVCIDVGVLNPLRILEGVNGASQIDEIGDPRTEQGFRALLAMDPYQHIRDGVRYPAVLLSIGLNDHRVSTWHTGKFAARLQAASASGKPVLIRLDEDAGHTPAALTRDQVAALAADRLAFLFGQLGGLR